MIKDEVKELFVECFSDTANEADIILGFAESHGQIFEKRINGELVNIICTAQVFERLPIEYVFACGTKKEFRGRGIFKEQLNKAIGNKPAILIPENESLFKMYEGMGFEPIYCLEADFGGSGASACEISADELYSQYKNCCLFPKKSFNAFNASFSAFLSYKNTVTKHKNAVMLMQGETASEIFAPNEEDMLFAASRCKKALLPLNMSDKLEKLHIKYRKKKLAAAKNLPYEVTNDLFINNLFN